MRRVGRAKPKRESNSPSAEAIVRPGTPNIERDFKRKSNCDFAFSLFNMAATGPTCTGGADIGKREDPRDEASKELYLFLPCGLFPYISNKFIKKIQIYDVSVFPWPNRRINQLSLYFNEPSANALQNVMFSPSYSMFFRYVSTYRCKRCLDAS